jgi:hypothetical protein
MTLSRRGAWFLVFLLAWNAYVWATFVKNVYPDHHLDGFFVVHAVIGGVTVALSGVAAGIGVRALRAHRRRLGVAPGPDSSTAHPGRP